MPQRVSCSSAALASLLSPSHSLPTLSYSLYFLLHCLLAAVHFIICLQLLLLPHVPAASSILFLLFSGPSLSLALFLSLSVLHYSSALAWPFAVVWGQFEPGSWSTGGSILSQALNLRASNCIKSVSSDLSLASPTPTVLVVPAAHPLRHPFTLDNFSFVSPPLLLCAEAFHIVDADVPLYALSLTLSHSLSLLLPPSCTHSLIGPIRLSDFH